MTAEQTELIEKLNCLEFETSQLNHAYKLWRSDVEQGKAPEWMAAAIRVTYDALIACCLDTNSAMFLDTSHDNEIGSSVSAEIATRLRRALADEDSTTGVCLRPGQRLQYEHAETDPPVYFTAVADGSLALTPVRQQNRIEGMLALAEVPRAVSAGHLPQLEAAACEVSGVLGQEDTSAEPHAGSFPTKEPARLRAEMPVAISPTLTGAAFAESTAMQLDHPKDASGAEPATARSLVTLRLPHWLQGSSTRLFGAASVAILVSVAILMIAGGTIGIYLASPHRTSRSAMLPVENSAAQAAAGGVAIATGQKAEFKFAPDPVVAPLGSSLVLNAVLSRGSDIRSMGVQIDYDPNLLQFMGVSQGGLLVKSGRQVVIAQRDDPLAGVLKISAEQAQGNPGISGDGPVFALSFHARKKGKGIVSIVSGAHDSQGRRIEMAGSQVSVRIH